MIERKTPPRNRNHRQRLENDINAQKRRTINNDNAGQIGYAVKPNWLNPPVDKNAIPVDPTSTK
jgi:hypothetical protein